jgi:hypothetical protein
MLMGAQAPLEPIAIMMTLNSSLEKISNQMESRLLLQMKQHPLLQMIRLLTTLLRFVDARSQTVVKLIHSRANPWLSKVVRPNNLTSGLTTIDLLTFIVYERSFIMTTLMFTRLSRRTRSAPRTLPSPMSMTGKYSAPLLSAAILNRMRAKPSC